MQNIHYNGEHYFAAANTFEGFKSSFGDIFNRNTCNRIYILKGGPGCGKSTFMKKIAEECEKNGLGVVYYHCSSDANSLDGILIKETKVAVVDGTSPHCMEATVAGAFETIIDLGKAWDTDGLYKEKENLFLLSDIKKAHYADAYNNLAAHKKILDILHMLCIPFHDKQKSEKCAKALFQSICRNNKKQRDDKKEIQNKNRICLTNALSCNKKIHLCSFEDMANTCIFVKDVKNTALYANDFLKNVYALAKEKGTELVVSLSPIDTSIVDGLYFVKEKVSVTLYNKELIDICDKTCKKCRIINMSRFFNSSSLSPVRRERKFYADLASSLEEKALSCLYLAGKTHFLLEDSYRNFTDYNQIEKITDDYCKKISVMQTLHQ